MAAPSRPLNVGIIGLGQGAASILSTIATLPEIELVAATARNPTSRKAFLARYPSARAYSEIAVLCTDPDVEAVCISTPNEFHCEHAVEAMRHGKHVIVEKPMAVTLDEADRMVETAERHGVKLLAGFTDGLSLPIRAMRRIALSGAIGRPRAMLSWSYTDWMLRPRTPQELAPEAGLGVIHRQAPHQLDAIRLVGGGKLRSVQASIGDWMPERAVPGFYTAHLEFEDGTSAAMTYNGYGYFMTLELFPEVAHRHKYDDAERLAIRREMRGGTRDDVAAKSAIKVGGSRETASAKITVASSGLAQPWTPMDLGMFVVSCERGDMRPVPNGVALYDDEGRREIDLRALAPGERLDRGDHAAFRELHAAVVEGKPLYHDGAWGRATLEATLAIIASAKTQRPIRLQRQVAMPEAYDADLPIDPPRKAAHGVT